jgi:hypothetical protein
MKVAMSSGWFKVNPLLKKRLTAQPETRKRYIGDCPGEKNSAKSSFNVDPVRQAKIDHQIKMHIFHHSIKNHSHRNEIVQKKNEKKVNSTV